MYSSMHLDTMVSTNLDAEATSKSSSAASANAVESLSAPT
jgi:hypothetical protein